MADQLNINRILPPGRPQIEVKGTDNNSKNRHNKQFEKQLDKEEKDKKKKQWNAPDDQEIVATRAPLDAKKKIKKDDDPDESKKQKIIDIRV